MDKMTQEDAMNMNDEQAVDILKALMLMMVDQHGCPISDAYFALDKAIEALQHSEPQWIPCNWHKDTENLPDECKSVLICIEGKIDKYVDVSYRTDYNLWERYGRNVNVVAWMPLPPSYIEEKADP